MITISFLNGKSPVKIDAENMREAVEKAIADGIDLRGAYLRWADLRGADLRGADLRWADLRGADIDYSCWPMWCGSLKAKLDKRLFVQLLYHTVRAGQSVDDPEVQSLINSDAVIALANQFHHVEECGEIKKVRKL